MRAQRLTVQQILQRDGLLLVVVVDVHLVRMARGQLIHIGAQGLAAASIVQLPGAAHPFQVRDHRHEGRDADTAGKEDMLASAQVQRKQVHRIGDRHGFADLDLAVHEQRAATALVIPPDGDGVFGRIRRIGHQRIRVETRATVVVHLDHGMRARRERRKGQTVTAREFEPGDQIVQGDNGADLDLDLFGACLGFLGGSTHLYNSTGSGTFPGSSASTQTPWKAASRRE